MRMPTQVRRRYMARLSGPLIDRIDLRVRLEAVTSAQLVNESVIAESSAAVSKRVVGAREAAADRWRTPWPPHQLGSLRRAAA